MKILLVEDDMSLGKSLAKILNLYGNDTVWVRDLSRASDVLGSTIFDLILLDLSLPDGFATGSIKKWRDTNIDTPIIVLTAFNEVQVLVMALDLGADDFISKPFEIDVLISRIRTVVRRSCHKKENKNGIIVIDELTFNPNSHQAYLGNYLLGLSPTEFTLLGLLLKNAGVPVRRSELEDILYSTDADDETPCSNSLEVHIFNLRKKLNNNKIRTKRNIGYLYLK